MPVGKKTVPVRRPAAAKCVVGIQKKAPAKKTSVKNKIAEPADTTSTRNRASHIRSAVDRLNDPPPAPLPALLKRVSSAIERELTQIEIIICGTHVHPRHRTEAERRARTLASLARTLREVMLLRDREEKNCEDDDTVPRDLDEFRRQLAQRLDELVADAKAAHPGEAE
ncbi:hypothetical protein [Afipia felis]|uniref:Uncharacterized protein n=2 Tax=Afipia felis TaxID=1035 RepID=A0A380W937_AFIFE|nr:hypothetical protein [Afipia felis]EKS28704.1 hypothetical protein HMPREF9697_01232 [Afipia felis ATCC 53690]SUU77411.1 Uncharacterised protein [Afipia felis]SUU85478.1 Uncharacterised protein [Afipia felis]